MRKTEPVSWRDLILDALLHAGESANDIVECVPPIDSEQMRRPFDSSYGSPEGCAFTMWTRDRVYFPVMYDGSEWVESAPRNPNGQAMSHVGG